MRSFEACEPVVYHFVGLLVLSSQASVMTEPLALVAISKAKQALLLGDEFQGTECFFGLVTPRKVSSVELVPPNREK